MLFGSSKPRVGKEEFSRVLSNLSAKGFTQREREDLQKIFRADMYETSELEQGIDTKEIEAAITWMRTNPSKHTFSTEQISLLEQELRNKL